MKRLLILSLAVLCMSQTCAAQSQIRGKVVDEDDNPVSYATVALLSRTDSTQVGGGFSGEDGLFSIACDSAEVLGRVSYIGMAPSVTPLYAGRENTVVLKADTHMLEEVFVDGGRSYHVKHTATGEIYYLSKYAKNMKNPFMALQEIPKLRIDMISKKVEGADGKPYLILIDGRSVNTGISPIDPKEIASVEVIDAVDARYMHKGVRKILNIRLKKKRKPYLWRELDGSTTVPSLMQSGASGAFETGSPRFSVYGNMEIFNIHHKERERLLDQETASYGKHEEGTEMNNFMRTSGRMALKWNPDEKNYLAGQFYAIATDFHASYVGRGVLVQEGDHAFGRESSNNGKSYILTASMLFEHNFSDSRKLELNAACNLNGDRTEGEREETYEDMKALSGSYPFKYKNRRSSATVDADYTQSLGGKHSLAMGSALAWTNDRIDKTSDHVPVFNHKELSEYLYASFNSQWGRLSYMASAGVKGTWLKAGDESNGYLTPHLSVSGSYRLGSSHSVSARFSQTSSSPSVGMLNPYNMSTDPLVVSRGNPKLKPEVRRGAGGGYSFNHNNLSISLSTDYEFSSDIIEPYAYTENGVFVSTYRNMGRYGLLEMGAYLSYNLPKGLGHVYLNETYRIDYFEGMKHMGRNNLGMGFNVNLKKWNISGDLSIIGNENTPISRTKDLAPSLSMVSASCQLTPSLLLYVRSYWILGLKYETTTSTDSYTSYSWTRQKDTWCPLVGIRYSFQKNTKQKIKKNNVTQVKEQGIKL